MEDGKKESKKTVEKEERSRKLTTLRNYDLDDKKNEIREESLNIRITTRTINRYVVIEDVNMEIESEEPRGPMYRFTDKY